MVYGVIMSTEEKTLLLFYAANKEQFINYLGEHFKKVNPELSQHLNYDHNQVSRLLNVDLDKLFDGLLSLNLINTDVFNEFIDESKVYSDDEITDAIGICNDEIIIALDEECGLSHEQDECLIVMAQYIHSPVLVNLVIELIYQYANDYEQLKKSIQDIDLYGEIMNKAKVKSLCFLFISKNIDLFEAWLYSLKLEEADGIKLTTYVKNELMMMDESNQSAIH